MSGKSSCIHSKEALNSNELIWIANKASLKGLRSVGACVRAYVQFVRMVCMIVVYMYIHHFIIISRLCMFSKMKWTESYTSLWMKPLDIFCMLDIYCSVAIWKGFLLFHLLLLERHCEKFFSNQNVNCTALLSYDVYCTPWPSSVSPPLYS